MGRTRPINKTLAIFAGVFVYGSALMLVWGFLASPSTNVVRNAYGKYFVDGTPIVNFEQCAEEAKKEPTDPVIQTFRHDIPDIDKVLESNAINGNDIHLLVTNSGFAQMTSNFLCWTDRLGLDNLVLATTDQKAAEFFGTVKNRPVIFDPLRTFSTDTHKFGTEGHRTVASSKMFYVYEILRRGYNVFLSDVDIIPFEKDVFQYVKQNHPCDLAIQSDSPPPYSSKIKLNTGFFYIRSNPRTIRFLEKVLSYRLANPDQHEQEALNNVLAKDERCISTCVLDRYLYPNGHMFFTYKLVEKAQVKPKMVHVNYYEYDSKVALLKHHKWWILDPKEEGKCVNLFK
ncbi:hypothetical protein P9112_004697 [Eukaryota sp. TZLM1-RC]